jgi:hypothetical protein
MELCETHRSRAQRQDFSSPIATIERFVIELMIPDHEIFGTDQTDIINLLG